MEQFDDAHLLAFGAMVWEEAGLVKNTVGMSIEGL